jgi:multidrug resistance efflux pump
MKHFISKFSAQIAKVGFPPTSLLKGNGSSSPSLRDEGSRHHMLLTPPPTWSRTLIWTLGLGSIALLAWSCVSRVEETSSLPGQLETLRPEASIKSPDSAQVETVNVRQHQLVQKGQVLFTLSRGDLEPRLHSLPQKLSLLNQKGQRDDLGMAIRLDQSRAKIQLNANLVDRLRSLVSQGSVQEVQLLEKENDLFQSKADYQSLLEDKERMVLQRQIEINDVTTQLRELRDRAKQFAVISPITGTLQQVAIQASGQRVQQGELLATVVPSEGLIASVQVSSKLAAPIVHGKKADITVDAFPANENGTLKGIVDSLSPTTAAVDSKGQAQAYSARIRIPPSGIPKDFPASSLRSGMGITARVVLHEKPVITMVFDFLEDLFKPMSDRR